jgi:hypothetical protein
LYANKYLQLLIPIGSALTFTGVFYFFKDTNLAEQFRKDDNEDILTFFWNVVVLKLWTGIFIVWMIVMNMLLLFQGLQ